MTRRNQRKRAPKQRSEAPVAPRLQVRKQPADASVSQLVLDLGRMIELARQQVAQTANAALTTLYWQLGKRVQTQILASQRAEYGAQIVAALGRQLESRFGRGFGEKILRRMVQFADAFPDAGLTSGR